jgi:uncharacterized membrane protein
MKKKTLLAVCSVTAAAALAFGLAACGDNGMTAEKASEKIATFTTSPTVIDATFKQTYQLAVDSTNASFKAFEKDIDDTVVIQADYTTGNVYYYGKKTAKDNSVTEQLVYKDGSTYYWMTTTSVKTALTDEAAAKTKINELIASLSKETTGYVDGNVFTYNTNWVQTYILLGSSNISATSRYFEYTYDNADNDGLKIDIDMQYVGYYGDQGVVDMGTDTTHTGATASITTTSDGYITSFSETMNNHMEMPVSTPPVPLDLTGTRSLTATYGGTLTKKTTITQNLVIPTVTFANSTNAAVAVTDMVIEGQTPTSMTVMTSGDSIAIGHWVAVKVTTAEGYEVDTVTVGGKATTAIASYYCYQVTEADYNTELKVAVNIKTTSGEVVTTGTIVVDPATVEGCTIKTYNYALGSDVGEETTTVTVGNFVAVKVECESGYEVASVTVNGNAAANYSGYYCYKATEAGVTYTVTVTLKAAASSGDTTTNTGTIAVQAVEHATVKTYDYALGSSVGEETTTVTVGNFVAVQVVCESGYEVASVTVNGNEATNYGGYYCYKATEAGATYTVVVTLRPVSAS